jgi:hypothetical protein
MMNDTARQSAWSIQQQIVKNYGDTSSQSTFLWAFIWFGIILALDRWILPETWQPAVRNIILHKGIIPRAILWSALFGLLYLFQIWRRVLQPLQLAAEVEQDIVGSACKFGLGSGQLESKLMEYVRLGSGGYFFTRFVRLHRLFIINNDRAAVERLRSEILENDDYNHQLSFAAVRWSEWAMPLLGFLGTVVGIGKAIGSLEGGIQWDKGGNVLLNPSLIKISFEGMATAFETTLLGLTGVLIVGLFHAFLRKRLNKALATAESTFTKSIEKTRGTVPSVSVTKVSGLSLDTSDLQNEIRYMAEEMTNLHVEMDGVNRKLTAQELFRREILGMAETVIAEEPRLESVKRILFTPVVAFSRAFEKSTREVETFISDSLKTKSWSIDSVGSGHVSDRCYFLIQSPKAGASGICIVNVPSFGPNAWHEIPPEFNNLKVIGPDHAILTGLNTPVHCWHNGDMKSLQKFETGGGNMPAVLPFYFNEIDYGALLICDTGAECIISSFQLPNMIKKDFPFSLIDLDFPIKAALASDNTKMIIAGAKEKAKPAKIYHIPLHFSLTDSTKNKNKKDRKGRKLTITAEEPLPILLPDVKGIKSIEFISSKEILIVEDNGAVWLMDIDHQFPVRLDHDEWKDYKDIVLKVGRNRWCAVCKNDQLSMWRIRKGGRIHRYSDLPSLQATGLNSNLATTVDDGRYLIAGIKNKVALWRYPEYEFEQKE